MKQLLLALTAISFAAVAQTVPGVSLSGPVDDPLLTNNSGKTIIAALAVMNKQGWAPLIIRAGFWNKSSIVPGASGHLVGPSAKRTGGTIVSVDLYAVVFEDGEIRGKDAYQFQEYIEGRIASRAKLGALVSAGRWSDIELASGSNNQYGDAVQAKELLAMRQNGGDQAARDLAKKYQTTPAKLWKGN